MKYTPIMWDVFDDGDNHLGYIEIVGNGYHATTSVDHIGSRERHDTYMSAGEWLYEQFSKKATVTDAELTRRPNALTDPNA